MLGFGLFGRIWVRIGLKGDKALRRGCGGTYRRMDRQIPPVFYRTSPPLGPLPKKAMVETEKAMVETEKAMVEMEKAMV